MENKLQPSSATWKVMKHVGIVPDINALIGLQSSHICTVEDKCQLTELAVNREICNNSNATNEGHPTLLCGIFVSHVVTDINRKSQKPVKFEIYPVVKEEDDRRENKLSDYSIYKIMNKLTYIVIEVKLSVGASLTCADQDSLAQLFLEAYYVYSGEGRKESHIYTTILAVLTDGTTWHLITTDMSSKPLKFISLSTISTRGLVKWDSGFNLICDECRAFVREQEQKYVDF